jgi:SPP1 gp7 family putative phage head morphogenesis protein
VPTPLDSQFWQDEEGELWAALIALYVNTLTAGMEGGIDALPPDLQPLVDVNEFNRHAAEYARQYRYELIKGINDTTREQVQTLMREWVLSNEPLSALEAKLKPIFGKVRAEMIAATEVTRIFQSANQMAWSSTGFVRQVKWQTSVDSRVCPICAPRHGTLLPLDDTSGHPPGHIRCRCWTLPVVDEDAVAEQIERILNS